MKKRRNVIFYFLPGAGGNFFSRCVNLLENSYCFYDTETNQIPITINDKQRLLSYDTVINTKFSDRNWVEFENSIQHVYFLNNNIDELNLPDNSLFVGFTHPSYESYALVDSICAPHDDIYTFYIDETECYEWCLMNALYKNSILKVEWMSEGKKCLTDPLIHKINLKNIVDSKDKFLIEFNKVCAIIQHTLTKEELLAVEYLYSQWKTTILHQDNISDFKKEIGFKI